MPKVPPSPKPFKSSAKATTFYCFPKGTSEADKQHDIAQVEKLIDYVRSKRKVSTNRRAK